MHSPHKIKIEPDLDSIWSIYSIHAMDYVVMREEIVTIQNKLGLHARAAAVFSKQAGEFSSRIEVVKNQMKVNGKSIMELLTIAAVKGCNIAIRADGEDEEHAIKALVTLVNDGFGEK
jgi:phosphocarrier protein HPr